MLAIIGLVVVTGSVLLGFALEGGPMALLLQPYEMMIILGTAAGTLLVGSSPAILRQMTRQVQAMLRGHAHSRESYLDLLMVLYELFVKAKKNGLISLEKDLSAPAESPLFARHPRFLANHEAVEFTCEALRMLVDGTIRPDEFEAVLDAHLETHHEEEGKPAALLQKVGDTLPGLGIVAAVLGIIITMQHVDGKPQEIGHYVAVALVGTFLGVVMSYGYVQPLASGLERQAAEGGRFLVCIKNGLVGFARGAPPLVAVEIARHVIFSDSRPGADEVAEACRAAMGRG